MLRQLVFLALAGGLSALPALSQIVPPGKVRVPDDEKPSKPFVWSERRLLTAPELFDAPDEWVDRSLQWVDFILANYRPSIPEHPLRRAALIRLDDILHLESAPRNQLVQKFYVNRMRRAIEEIEQSKVESGMRIWKLYNCGFLVRTPTVSYVFDIVPGLSIPGFTVPPELMDRLVKQADAHFISHFHNDHANQSVVRLFLAQNKPVIAAEGLWKNLPEFASKLIYPQRSTEIVHSVPVRGGSQTLKYVAYPGHQGAPVLNNLHLVISPEGLSVMQTGDQWNDEDKPGSDFDWIAQIGRQHQVDVLLPNAWSREVGRIVRGVNPQLVITSHENEMSHTVDHREDYTQTYTRFWSVPYPLAVMTWGESYHFQRAEVPKLGLR